MKLQVACALGALFAAALLAGCTTETAERTATPRPGLSAVPTERATPTTSGGIFGGTVPLGSPPATARAATPASCAPPYPSGPPTADTVLCADPASMLAARVLRIVDGDTLHVSIDGRDETVRLFGINAREVGEPCSAEATARLRELAGQEVRLRADARDRDRYGRLLRYVYTPQGLSVDAEVTAEGLAYAWTADGALRGPIIELERRAQDAHRGCLWQTQ